MGKEGGAEKETLLAGKPFRTGFKRRRRYRPVLVLVALILDDMFQAAWRAVRRVPAQPQLVVVEGLN